jgi:histidine triad (HIT) family protein
MATIFSKIISGEIPCYKIAEDEMHLAFLDINPLAKGHTLVIPKFETDNIFDLSDSDLSSLHLFAKKVATALQKSIHCKKIGVAIVGLEVAHAHIHLIPINKVGDMNFANSKLILSADELMEIQQSIICNL